MSMIPVAMIKRFWRDEGGTALVETVIMLPLLLWAIFGLFVFWDAHKSINGVQKASYTVSDVLSRRRLAINQTYVDGLRTTMDFLIVGNASSKLRVSSIKRNETAKRFEVVWSYSPGNGFTARPVGPLLTDVTRIPMMSDGDYIMLVETEVPYKPAFNIGLNSMQIKNFIVTRPRNGKICMTGSTC